MDTGVIIAIVVGVLILLALLWFLGRKGRERRHETRRVEAREIRREAEVGSAQADKTRAEAEAQAAEARRQEALARERQATADEQHREARERHIEAARKDPDMDPDEAAAEFDRRQAEGGTTTGGPTGATTGGATGGIGTGAGTTTGADATGPAPTGADTTGARPAGDQSVEHYERTSEPGVERERRFERDEQGDVVRDEQIEQPRRRE